MAWCCAAIAITTRLRKLLADNAVPFINVGVYRPDRPYPCVGTDNEAAAYRAAAHVIELGHRRIGIVSALQRNNDRASARVDGFRRALSENGIEMPPQWHVEVPYTLDDAREAARYLLGLDERPDRAWFAATTSSPMACCWKPSAAVFRSRAICRSSASTISTGAGICGRA